VEGDDVECAIAVCDQYANTKLLAGELRVIQHWLEILPEEWFLAYPGLNLMRAGFLSYRGDIAGCFQCIDETEQQLLARDTEDARWQMGRVLAIRCFLACAMNNLADAEEFADQALTDLAEDDLGYRPGIYNALGDTYRRNGRWNEAQSCYLKVLEFPRSPAVRVQSAHVYGALADLDLRQGRLREAEQNWRNALAAIDRGDSWGILPLPVIGWIYIRLAEILYEWNELSTAQEYLQVGLDRAELGGDVRTLIAGYVIAGRMALGVGDLGAATDYLEKARPLVEQAEFQEWSSRFERFQLETWLAQDHLRSAVNWADDQLVDDMMQRQPETEATLLAVIRTLIVARNKDSLQRALSLLQPLL
jgi:LuxR family maltose regulon positive regulatory protein